MAAAPHRGELADFVSSAVDALKHRGPDSHGIWTDHDAGVVFGHARLAVLDLSDGGKQPMISRSGRYSLTYNGEIYNFKELRAELEASGSRFRTVSDTEVILASIETWGIGGALHRFNGMFAFGLWDAREGRLTLALDRFGVKPLYYGDVAGAFVFASELKAIRSIRGFRNGIDRGSLDLFMRYGTVPGPHSIFEGIRKLEPGCCLTYEPRSGRPFTIERYWSSVDEARHAQDAPFTGDLSDAADLLEEELLSSVSLRMRSDVPVGAFLSGGIDSSAVVAVMQQVSTAPVRTYTVGFDGDQFSEADHARAVAEHLGTVHTELVVDPADALAVIPELAHIYDEPFADSSQIPTVLVSRLARSEVTVALSGDGGDELFGGYNRHRWAPKVWSRTQNMPRSVMRPVSFVANRAVAAPWDSLVRFVGSRFPSMEVQGLRHKAEKMASVLTSESEDDLYGRLVSSQSVSGLVLGDRPSLSGHIPPSSIPMSSFTEQMLIADLVGYLPNDILVKVDRASMSVGLEARVPLLDHNLARFAWSLPLEFRVASGEGKRVLRQALYRRVPRELVDRPKAGFAIPLAEWLRGPLQEWARTLLETSRIKDEDYLDTEIIDQLWAEFIAGADLHQEVIWSILMFESWLGHTPSAGDPSAR